MFMFKKLFSRLFFPVPLSLELLLIGIFLLWCTRRQRLGKVLVTFSAALLMLLSSKAVSDALLRPLETRYPPLPVFGAGLAAPAVNYIVVLGGGIVRDPNVPVSNHVTPDQMLRLIEALRLHREIPGAKLILSEGWIHVTAMTDVAEALGVAADDIVQLPPSRDTGDEARHIAEMVGRRPFILVTSASHMPRAIAYCHKQGLQPIAAPTDYLAPRGESAPDDVFPDGYKLFKSQTAFYEYLGLGWQALGR